MNLTWIIENLTKEQSYVELAEAVQNQNIDLVKINGDYYPETLDAYIDNPNVIVAASINMTKLLREKLPLAKIFSSFENYFCTKYYPIFGKDLFNDKYIMLPLAEFRRQKWMVYSLLTKESLVFVRPDTGDKSFTGQLLDIQEVERFFLENETYKNDLMIISTPKIINGEWRFVVSEKQEIISVSCYRYRSLKTLVNSAPEGATNFCKNILKKEYFPDRVFCIDIAEDSEGNFWLLELTSFSSAGLYACDKNEIVKRVSDLVLNE